MSTAEEFAAALAAGDEQLVQILADDLKRLEQQAKPPYLIHHIVGFPEEED